MFCLPTLQPCARASCYRVDADTDFYCSARNKGNYPSWTEVHQYIWLAHANVLYFDIVRARSKSIKGKLLAGHANIILHVGEIRNYFLPIIFHYRVYMEYHMQECLRSLLKKNRDTISTLYEWFFRWINAKYMQNIKEIIPTFLWQIIKNNWHYPRKMRHNLSTDTHMGNMHARAWPPGCISSFDPRSRVLKQWRNTFHIALYLVHLSSEIAFHQNV